MSQEQRRVRAYPGVGTYPPRGGAAERWEMAIYGDLTDKQSDLIGRLVEVPPRSRGTIFFDSAGGSVYTGLALASIIKLRGLEADGVVASECSSAALLPFAACRRRFVTPHSTLLFHPVRWQSEEDVRLEEAAEWARHFEVMEKDIDALLAKMFGCPEDMLRRWTRQGHFVSGAEMVQAGMAEMIDLFAGDLWSQMAQFPKTGE